MSPALVLLLRARVERARAEGALMRLDALVVAIAGALGGEKGGKAITTLRRALLDVVEDRPGSPAAGSSGAGPDGQDLAANRRALAARLAMAGATLS